MKIAAPALKLEMALESVELREGRPVIVCRMGVYDATTELSREDLRTFMACLMKPSIFFAFCRVIFSSN